MLDQLFAVRSYIRYDEFQERECVICNRVFSYPVRFGDRVTTCSSYCQGVALSLKKMKGEYVLCHTCNKPVWKQPCHLKGDKRHYCSKECTDLGWSIYYEIDFGEEKINTGRKKYYGANWLVQRRKARERDRYQCQECGITEDQYGKELSVHHIKPFVYFETYKEANKLENLLSVCELCHRKIHSGTNNHHNFEIEKIVFKNELNTVATRQQEVARLVVDLLFNSDKNLTEIAEITGLSYSGVERIYKGERWKQLYDSPAKIIKPRSKGNRRK